jgi:hypothetical protein
MADRTIKRNGRGQIVSYEIVGVNDSTVSTLQYGKVLFKIAGQSGTYADKYNFTSFSNEINVVVSDELIDSDTIINPQITLGDIISENDTRAVGPGAPNVGTGGGSSIDTSPFGAAGTYVGENRAFIRPDGAPEFYEWVGTFWQPV